MSGLGFRTLCGEEIAPFLDDLARLRITVFREWPYLYAGDRAYERAYLDRYAQGETVQVAAFDDDRMVGAATGMPLSEHADDFAAAFDKSDVDLADVFYCAESVVLPEHRGQGAGHVFFDRREAHARARGYTHVCFASVLRDAVHPARPRTYRSLDAFWRKRGYAPLDGAIARFAWRDLGEAKETEKPLQVWMRQL